MTSLLSRAELRALAAYERRLAEMAVLEMLG